MTINRDNFLKGQRAELCIPENAGEDAGPCRICGKDIGVIDFNYHQHLRICSDCAEVAANLWWMAHSGEYLTWPNPARGKRRRKQKIDAKLKLKVWQRDGFKCVTCKSQENLTCDHVIPEAKGGETSFENLQTMCLPCNLKKGVRMP